MGYATYMKPLNTFRKAYYFGYGADRESEMITAIIGRKPKIITTAILHDYELRIQTLAEVSNKGEISPKKYYQILGTSILKAM